MRKVDPEMLKECYESSLKEGLCTLVFKEEVSRYYSFIVTYFCWTSNGISTWLKVTRTFDDGDEAISAEVKIYNTPFRLGNTPTFTARASYSSYAIKEAWESFFDKLKDVEKKEEIVKALSAFIKR